MSSLEQVFVVIDGLPFKVRINLTDDSLVKAYGIFSENLKKHRGVLNKFMKFGKEGKVDIDWNQYTKTIDGFNPPERKEIDDLVAAFNQEVFNKTSSTFIRQNICFKLR